MARFWLCLASAMCLAGYCGANYCRDANLCCPGRDSSCVVQKAHQNAIIEDLTDKPCYCDHACLKLGDCCPDFRETCGDCTRTLEPPGLCRNDGKRPDGLTLVPWAKGKSLLWDATCACTFAATNVGHTTKAAGAAAESAAKLKHSKYEELEMAYTFVPLAVETAGVWCQEAKDFVRELGRRVRESTGDPRAGSYLRQRISLAIQRGNAASVMGAFPSVVDCVVSSWGEWSECDTRCGSGSMVRSRVVLQAPAHGGKHCPSLVQRRVCQEHHGCEDGSVEPLREETAMILPGSLSVSRHSNETVDIRKNLRLRNPDDPESNSHREYCVQFEVTKVSKACHIDSEYKALREGSTVCVLCETAALRRDLNWRCGGHGVVGHTTRYYALVAPHCHGKWLRTDHTPDKTSECCVNPDFIFV